VLKSSAGVWQDSAREHGLIALNLPLKRLLGRVLGEGLLAALASAPMEYWAGTRSVHAAHSGRPAQLPQGKGRSGARRHR
jgi:hypothetical protein